MDVSPVADYGSRPRRPDASMSLLNDLMTNTLDEDYAQVAAERGRTPSPQGKGGGYVGLVVATLVFGLLLAVAAVQTDRGRPAQQEERAQLIERIHEQGAAVDELGAQASALASDVAALQAELAASTERADELERRVRQLGMVTGSQAVRGPGIQITVDDANPPKGHEGQVLDTDLQTLVNGLWVAGAEAISINGQRIGAKSSIRSANQAITVNFKSLRRPYVVSAIGNPDTMEARFLETEAGQAWLDYQRNFGVRFETVTKESMTVPARAIGRLRYATETHEVPE